MDREPRKTRTSAKALTAPRPRRVSLCKAGANQAPIVRSKTETIVVKQEDMTTMIGSMKAQGFAMAGITFKGADWKRSKVDAWLQAGGYDGYDVAGADGDWTVTSKSVAEGESRTINTPDGIAITLVKAAIEDVADKGVGAEAGRDASEGAASDVQPVATVKAADIAAGTITGSIIAMNTIKGADLDKVFDIVARCKAAPLTETRTKSLYTVSQFADLIRSLRWLVSEMSWDDTYASDGDTSDDGIATALSAADTQTRETIIADLKAMGTQMLSSFAALVNIEVGEFAESFKSAQEATMTETTKTAEGAAPASEGAEGVVAAVEAKIEGAVEGAVAAVEAKVEGAAEAVVAATEAAVTGTVAKVEEQAPAWFSAFADKITTDLGALSDRVKAVEPAPAEKAAEPSAATAVPARKSADADEVPSGSTVSTKAAQKMEHHRLKAALGL